MDEACHQLVGCIPTYWKIFFGERNPMKYSECRTTEQMKNLTAYLPYDNEFGRMKIFGMYKMPCAMMQVSIDTDSEEYYNGDLLKIRFSIRYF